MRRAATGPHLVAEVAARARVHRANQHEPRRECNGSHGARDPHRAFLERLAQHFQDVPAELRHLVEEEHALVRQADLTRPRRLTAADERDIGDRVVRRAKRPFGHEPGAAGEEAGDRMDRRDLERLLERQRRQHPGHAPRHHRLSGAGRPHHQGVVPAGRRDLERAPRERLSVHVREIPRTASRWRHGRRRIDHLARREGRGIVQRADRLGQASARRTGGAPGRPRLRRGSGAAAAAR